MNAQQKRPTKDQMLETVRESMIRLARMFPERFYVGELLNRATIRSQLLQRDGVLYVFEFCDKPDHWRIAGYIDDLPEKRELVETVLADFAGTRSR